MVKNHSFLDGNKRIDDSTLVAVTIMIAESKPEEKDAMVALVVNFLPSMAPTCSGRSGEEGR